MKYIPGISLILLVCSCTVCGGCDIWVFSSDGEPVGDVAISWRNLTNNNTLYSNSTDLYGFANYSGDCENVSIKLDYPSTAYTSVLSNASCLSEAHINDFVSGRVQIKNNLGSYLEAQDCSVVIYESNSSNLVHDYGTLCKYGDYFIDDDGNYATITDCKVSDSLGWYYFKGEIKEGMGFEYDSYYDIVFTCNGKSETVTFKTILEKVPDVDKTEDFIKRYGGFIVLALVGGVIIILIVSFFVWLIKKK